MKIQRLHGSLVSAHWQGREERQAPSACTHCQGFREAPWAPGQTHQYPTPQLPGVPQTLVFSNQEALLHCL